MERDEFEGCERSRQRQQERQCQMKHRRGPGGGGQYRGAMGRCILQTVPQRGGRMEFAEPRSENDCRREVRERGVGTWRKEEVVSSGWKKVEGWEVEVVKLDQASGYGQWERK